MGNTQIKNAFSRPPVQSTANTCAIRQDQYNKLKQDLTAKQKEIDSCDPQGASQRQLLSSNSNVCLVKQVQYNQLQRDIGFKQKEIDDCDPQAALQRRLQEKRNWVNNYLARKGVEYNEATTQYTNNVFNASRLAKSANQLYIELDSKEKELAQITGNIGEMEKIERRERRKFLDNSPQDGVPGILGLHTSDDKTLLFFYLFFGLSITGLTLFVIQNYGAKLGITGTKNTIYTILLLLFISYGIAYYLITLYG